MSEDLVNGETNEWGTYKHIGWKEWCEVEDWLNAPIGFIKMDIENFK